MSRGAYQREMSRKKRVSVRLWLREPRYWKKSRELQNKVRWECDLIMRTLAQHVSSRTRSIRVRHTIPASTAKVSLQNISNYRLATGYRVIQLSMMLLRTEWLKRRKKVPRITRWICESPPALLLPGHVQESRNMRLEAQKKRSSKESSKYKWPGDMCHTRQ